MKASNKKDLKGNFYDYTGQWFSMSGSGTPDEISSTKLIEAAIDNKLDVVKGLIKNGWDVHVNDDEALCWSSAHGHLKVVKYLIENGANVHAKGDCALCWSSRQGHLEVVKYLVEKGANIHAMSNYALCYSSAQGLLNIVKYLVKEINKTNKEYIKIAKDKLNSLKKEQ